MNRHTQVWLANQPLWRDADMVKIGLAGLTVGFVIGSLICLSQFI